MKEKIIIGIAGEMASGKGTATQYLADRYGACGIRSSDVFRRVLQTLHMEETREAISETSRVLRLGFGEDIAMRVISQDLKESKEQLFVIEGIRRIDEVNTLKHGTEKFILVYLKVDMKERYARMVARNENSGDAEKTFEEFKKNHELNADSTVAQLEAVADYVVENGGSYEDGQKKIDEIMREVKK